MSLYLIFFTHVLLSQVFDLLDVLFQFAILSFGVDLQLLKPCQNFLVSVFEESLPVLDTLNLCLQFTG